MQVDMISIKFYRDQFPDLTVVAKWLWIVHLAHQSPAQKARGTPQRSVFVPLRRVLVVTHGIKSMTGHKAASDIPPSWGHSHRRHFEMSLWWPGRWLKELHRNCRRAVWTWTEAPEITCALVGASDEPLHTFQAQFSATHGPQCTMAFCCSLTQTHV